MKSIINISFIGYGNIAKAIAKSLSDNPNYHLRAASPSQQPCDNADGVVTHNNNLAILNDADMILLAVKPGTMANVLAQIKPSLPEDCLLVSLATGLSLSWMEQHSPQRQAIVRSMPNIASAIKKGATPLIANQYVSKYQKEAITQLFDYSGITTWITRESDMDLFTALSGSGPAYLFLFMEAMTEAAKKLGLSEEIARDFALQTFNGAAGLAKQSQLEFSALRKKVTSPGGTTAAAIHVFEQQGLEQLVYKAMEAACQRAKELSEPVVHSS